MLIVLTFVTDSADPYPLKAVLSSNEQQRVKESAIIDFLRRNLHQRKNFVQPIHNLHSP